jgi:hypothetical protein
VDRSVKTPNAQATDRALIGRKKIVHARTAVPSRDHVAVAAEDSEARKSPVNPNFTRKLPVHEAAAYLNLSVSCLNKKRVDGSGPPYLKICRRIVYDIYDLERWAAQTKRLHTSE